MQNNTEEYKSLGFKTWSLIILFSFALASVVLLFVKSGSKEEKRKFKKTLAIIFLFCVLQGMVGILYVLFECFKEFVLK